MREEIKNMKNESRLIPW